MLRRAALALVILSLAFAIGGCQAEAAKTPKILPDWSRARQVGISATNQPVSMTAEDDYVHVLFVAAEAQTLHYLRLDSAGDVLVSVDLEIDGAHPSWPRLLLHPDGSLLAFWTDNPDIPRALFAAGLSRDGQMLSQPQQLSPPGVRVTGFTVAGSADGSIDAFWANEIPTEGGIYHLELDQHGRVASDNVLLIAGGAEPSLQVGGDGMIHLTWVAEQALSVQDVYYGLFDPSTSELHTATRVSSYKTSTGLVAYPPRLALDNSTVYLFWAIERRGGGLAGAGSAETSFVAFPLGSPTHYEPRTLNIPNLARPSYETASGSLPYQHLASPRAGWPTSLLYMPSTLSGQGQEAGLYLVGEVATETQSSREAVWAIFSDGTLKGYQLPAQVGNALRPQGVIDERGNGHLAFLNSAGFGRYEVFYASTSRAVQANLDRVTMQDRVNSFFGALWTLAPAMGFFPPVLMLWGFLSFVWVVAFYFVKTEGGLDRRPAQIALVVSIVLYLASKLILAPGVLLYAPFLDRLPESLQFVTVLGTPLFTLLVALGAVWLYFQRRQYRSLFIAWIIFVMTDAVLSMIIYIPQWVNR
jgi:hypothetical protein